MPRQRAGSTARGYGPAHQKLRRQRLAQWRPGDPCAHCGQPMMYRWLLMPDGRRTSLLDLPHNEDRTGYLPGLAHRNCNRRDGQAKTTAILRMRGPLPPRQLAAVRIKQWQASTASTGRRAQATARTWQPVTRSHHGQQSPARSSVTVTHYP